MESTIIIHSDVDDNAKAERALLRFLNQRLEIIVPESSDRAGQNGAFILLAVCLAALTLPLSFSAGAVATPAIGRDLGASAPQLAWITNAFMLTFGGLLLVAGGMADRHGRKRVFLSGVAIFVLFSCALGAASSVWVIDLLRAGQGIGAAGALAAGGAVLAQSFEGHARTRAFSLLGTTFGVGLAFGPVVTGLLIHALGWRSIFLVSALTGLVALALGYRWVRESRAPSAGSFDWAGAISFTAMLAAFTTAMLEVPSLGWTHPMLLGLLAASAVLLGLFIAIELRRRHPILDLSLFRFRGFVGVQLLPVATCFGFVVLLVILPLRFIGIEHAGEITAGLLMMGLCAPMLVVPMLAARLARHIQPSTLSAVGLALAAIGLLCLGAIPLGDDFAIIAPMLLIGAGAGLPWGLMDGLSVSVVPNERAGMATGIFGTVRVAGEGVALAIVSALLAALIGGILQSRFGYSGAEALLAGQRLAVGDVPGAARLLPGLASGALEQAYGSAFTLLCWLLAGVTALCAFAVYHMLSEHQMPGASPASA